MRSHRTCRSLIAISLLLAKFVIFISTEEASLNFTGVKFIQLHEMELPPTTSIDAVIHWFTQRYHKPDVGRWIEYLRTIMNIRRLHINSLPMDKVIADWTITAKPGSHSPDFKSTITPDLMIRFGIFGGLGVLGIEAEIPIEWIIFGILANTITYADFPDYTCNHHRIIADPYPVENGSLPESRKFFHWYCRYYLGKRSVEDDSMIAQRQEKIKHHLSHKLTEISKQNLLQWSYQ
jgi:hypothetical protein